MSRPPVPDCLSLCPLCPEGERATLSFFSDDEEVRCPSCRRRLLVATRTVAAPTRQTPDGALSRYRIVTADARGRKSQTRFRAQPGVKLLIGERIALVRAGGRLVAIANQSSQMFYPVPAPAPSRARRAPELGALAAAVVLAVLIGARAVLNLGPAALGAGAAGAVVLCLVVGVVAAPWLSGLRQGRR